MFTLLISIFNFLFIAFAFHNFASWHVLLLVINSSIRKSILIAVYICFGRDRMSTTIESINVILVRLLTFLLQPLLQYYCISSGLGMKRKGI